jgi:large subunit ribosomal protein L7/L12
VNITEIAVFSGLILSLLLMIKAFQLQSRINDLTSDLEWLKNRPDGSPLPLSSPTSLDTTDHADDEIYKKIRSLLAAGHKIEAIKMVRKARDIGLKDAKDYVDHIEKGL